MTSGQTYGYTHLSDVTVICNGTDACPGGYLCGKQLHNPDFNVSNFDNLLYSFLMVFQVTTMEGWTPLMINLSQSYTPMVIAWFIMLVFIGNFFLLN